VTNAVNWLHHRLAKVDKNCTPPQLEVQDVTDAVPESQAAPHMGGVRPFAQLNTAPLLTEQVMGIYANAMAQQVGDARNALLRMIHCTSGSAEFAGIFPNALLDRLGEAFNLKKGNEFQLATRINSAIKVYLYRFYKGGAKTVNESWPNEFLKLWEQQLCSPQPDSILSAIDSDKLPEPYPEDQAANPFGPVALALLVSYGILEKPKAPQPTQSEAVGGIRAQLEQRRRSVAEAKEGAPTTSGLRRVSTVRAPQTLPPAAEVMAAFRTLLRKHGALSKVEKPLPFASTGPIGNWGILSAAKSLARTLPAPISARVVARRKGKFGVKPEEYLSAAPVPTTSLDASVEELLKRLGPGASRPYIPGAQFGYGRGDGAAGVEVKSSQAQFARSGVLDLSPSDSPAVRDAQWQILCHMVAQPDSVLIYHLKNHYACVYACREALVAAGPTSVNDVQAFFNDADTSSTSFNGWKQADTQAVKGAASGPVVAAPDEDELEAEENDPTGSAVSGGGKRGSLSGAPSDTAAPDAEAKAIDEPFSSGIPGYRLARQILVARKGQLPRWWIDFEEFHRNVSMGKIYCLMSIGLEEADVNVPELGEGGLAQALAEVDAKDPEISQAKKAFEEKQKILLQNFLSSP